MSSVVGAANAADNAIRDDDEAVRHRDVASAEQELSTKATVKLYIKAIIFSLIFSLSVIMEGYDTSLIGTFFGFQSSMDRNGDQFDPESAGSRIISARWQSILTIGFQASNFLPKSSPYSPRSRSLTPII